MTEYLTCLQFQTILGRTNLAFLGPRGRLRITGRLPNRLEPGSAFLLKADIVALHAKVGSGPEAIV